MDSFTKNLRTTYDWSIDRMNELCTDGEIEQLKDAVSIRHEVAEWLLREDKSSITISFLLNIWEKVASMIYN